MTRPATGEGYRLEWVYTPASSSYKNTDTWAWKSKTFYAATLTWGGIYWSLTWWNEEDGGGEVAGAFTDLEEAMRVAETLYRLHGGKEYPT